MKASFDGHDTVVRQLIHSKAQINLQTEVYGIKKITK